MSTKLVEGLRSLGVYSPIARDGAQRIEALTLQRDKLLKELEACCVTFERLRESSGIETSVELSALRAVAEVKSALGSSYGCSHEWDMETESCVKCGADGFST